MKLVIQRVQSACVKVDSKTVGSIEKGLFVLVGIKKGDTKANADYLAVKLSKLRVMPNPPSPEASERYSKMNLSVADAKASLLVVSQFTLIANTKDGNRPSFIDAQEPGKARQLYDYFIAKLKSFNVEVKTGSFGEYMHIETHLDGPVTIILES